MNVVVDIAGREALPIWTIPYVTSGDVGANELINRLVAPNYGNESTFPTAFNLDSQGKTCPIPSIWWVDTQTMLNLIKDDLDTKELPEHEKLCEWQKRSLEMIITRNAGCYLWLDELKKWLECRSENTTFLRQSDNGKKSIEYRVELYLNPPLPLQHELHFENQLKKLKSQTRQCLDDFPVEADDDPYGEPELLPENAISFHLALKLLGDDWTAGEFAVQIMLGGIRAFERKNTGNKKLKPAENFAAALMKIHGKTEILTLDEFSIANNLADFNYSKIELSEFKAECRHIPFSVASKRVAEFVGDIEEANGFLRGRLNSLELCAVLPLYGWIAPQKSPDGKLWQSCYLSERQLNQLITDEFCGLEGLNAIETPPLNRLDKEKQDEQISAPTVRLCTFIDRVLVEAIGDNTTLPTFYYLVENHGLLIRDKVIEGQIVSSRELLTSLRQREQQADKSFDDDNFQFWQTLHKESRYSVHRADIAAAYSHAGKSQFPWLSWNNDVAWLNVEDVLPEIKKPLLELEKGELPTAIRNNGADSVQVSTPSPLYEKKNNDFQLWISEVTPAHEDMKKADIHKALIARNSLLWTSGFPDWWKQQTIYKGTAGRKKLIR
jgi:hypothetical protein